MWAWCKRSMRSWTMGSDYSRRTNRGVYVSRTLWFPLQSYGVRHWESSSDPQEIFPLFCCHSRHFWALEKLTCHSRGGQFSDIRLLSWYRRSNPPFWCFNGECNGDTKQPVAWEAAKTHYGHCMMNITGTPLTDNGKVNLVPMPRARVHPSGFLCTTLLE